MRFAAALMASSAALLFAQPALAQDAPDSAQKPPKPIIVTGRGLDATPATPAYDTVVLDRKQVTDTGSGRIEDALSSVAGFQQFRRSDSRSSNPSAQGATLRALSGNATSRALVLLDGVPMVDPFFGYVPFSAITPERLASIRVTRGGGSGPFGSGALAGTIEMESADYAELGPLQGQVLVNDRGETSANLGLAQPVGGGFVSASAQWDRGAGFWTTPADQRVTASVPAAYDSWSGSARLVQPVASDIELQLRGLAFKDQRTLRFAGADNAIEGQDASIRLIGRGPWQFDVLAYGQWRNFSNIVISSTRFTKVLDQRDTPAEGQGGKIEVRPPLPDGQVLRLGVDYRRSHGTLAEDSYSAFSGALTGTHLAGGTNSDVGLFAEHEGSTGPLTLTAGVRADRWSVRGGYYTGLDGTGAVIENDTYANRAGWDFSWRGGLLLDVAPGVRLRSAAYTGLRQPTLNELYRPFVVFPVTTEANAALKNERLEGYEAGIDLTPTAGVRFSLTAFDNKVKNAIANVTIATNLRQRQNLDAIHARGIEFGTSLQLGEVSFDGSLAYTDAKVEASGVQAALDGLRPSQTPRWSASGTLAWVPAKGFRLAATLRHVGAQYEDDLETDILPPATTLDLFAQAPLWRGFSLVLRGENVFDAKIVTRNQGGSMDLGTPATVWAGIRYGY